MLKLSLLHTVFTVQDTNYDGLSCWNAILTRWCRKWDLLPSGVLVVRFSSHFIHGMQKVQLKKLSLRERIGNKKNGVGVEKRENSKREWGKHKKLEEERKARMELDFAKHRVLLQLNQNLIYYPALLPMPHDCNHFHCHYYSCTVNIYRKSLNKSPPWIEACLKLTPGVLQKFVQ